MPLNTLHASFQRLSQLLLIRPTTNAKGSLNRRDNNLKKTYSYVLQKKTYSSLHWLMTDDGLEHRNVFKSNHYLVPGFVHYLVTGFVILSIKL